MSSGQRTPNIVLGPQNRSSEVTYLLFATLPIALLALLFGYGKVQQLSTAPAYAAKLRQLQQSGQPISNAGLVRLFERSTTRKTSRQWRDIFSAHAAVASQFGQLTSSGVKQWDEIVAPEQPWSAAPFAEHYAELSQPVLESVATAIETPEPVWQPIMFDGYRTNLSDIHQSSLIIELLQLDFRVAVHRGDHSRALESLRLMRGVARAFDWPLGVTCALYTLRNRNAHDEMIRQSLAIDFWRSEDLLQLKQHLQDSGNLDQSWRQAVTTEMAMGIAGYETSSAVRHLDRQNPHLFGVPTASRKTMLDSAGQLASLTDAGTQLHLQQVDQLLGSLQDARTQSSTATDVPIASFQWEQSWFWPYYRTFASTLAQREINRRWTLTGLAIKQFQLQEHRWPKSLSELSKVGLTAADTRCIGSTPLGYRVTDNEALLWRSDPRQVDQTVPPVPPTIDPLATYSLDEMLLKLTL